MATNIKLIGDHEDKLVEIKDTYDIDASNAEIARQAIDMLYDERCNNES
jgi:hypothetical protein